MITRLNLHNFWRSRTTEFIRCIGSLEFRLQSNANRLQPFHDSDVWIESYITYDAIELDESAAIHNSRKQSSLPSSRGCCCVVSTDGDERRSLHTLVLPTTSVVHNFEMCFGANIWSTFRPVALTAGRPVIIFPHSASSLLTLLEPWYRGLNSHKHCITT